MTSLNISVIIELDAFEFTQKEYISPKGNIEQCPTDWEKYWQTSIKDAGLIKVRQIIPGFSFVDITQIDIDELKIIIETQLKDTEIKNEDEIISFAGGIVIQYNGKIITPQCCTSISNYNEWNDILNKKPSKWTQIWIGHPWLFARVKDNAIEFSEYCEQNEYVNCSIDNKLPKMIIDFDYFKTEFKKSIEEIRNLETKVANILKNIKIEKYTRISEILIEDNAE